MSVDFHAIKQIAIFSAADRINDKTLRVFTLEPVAVQQRENNKQL